MKVLVAYMSSTGNTKKVAEAIYGEIPSEKEIKPIADVQDVSGYDLVFLGFPVHQEGPDKKAKQMMERHCTKGRKVALFITHAAPEDEPELPEHLAKFKQAAAASDLVGLFDCQGELAGGVKLIMKISPSKKLRRQAKTDNSKGQPDGARLDRARNFARDIMSRAGSDGNV